MMKKTGIYLILFLLFSALTFAQPDPAAGDTLSLDNAVSRVISSHPSIQAAARAVDEAGGRIGLAKSAYLPEVEAGASYSRVGPVPSFDFPGYGTIRLFPEDNYSAGINVSQLLYDFGRTARSIELARASKDLSDESLGLVRQNLAMTVISTYYGLLMIQESLRISNDELDNLGNHLAFILKKKETGSATDYEILSTKVKISVIENRKVDDLARQETLSAVMNALLGDPVDNTVYVSNDVGYTPGTRGSGSMINTALDNREELKLAGQKEKLAQMKYDLTKTSKYPTFAAFASGGGKNGYVPELNEFKLNFAAGVRLKIPLYDANREKNNLIIARAQIESARFQSEETRRQISSEVIRARAELNSSSKKIEQFEMQVRQAQQAFDLARTNYQAGAITNLDLLDAEISLATSRLMLTRARIDNELNVARLRMAMGEKLYPVAE